MLLAPDHSVSLEPFLTELIGGTFRGVGRRSLAAVGVHRVVADILAGDVEPLVFLTHCLTQGGPSGFPCCSRAASPGFSVMVRICSRDFLMDPGAVGH